MRRTFCPELGAIFSGDCVAAFVNAPHIMAATPFEEFDMEKSLAASIIEGSLVVGQSLNELLRLVEKVTEGRVQKDLRRQIGDVMGRLYTDVMMPVIQQYPDLDPDRKED